ncbi:RGG repeats nuclear RNA binding protein C-like [Aegilops tauschii subsp. strangulata]|uniref:RGG repeats nuclear RNA binding protein C-like n=1 Tax=Aegilops tauschii subsp. strangulata TaxID=200361 RepID=UPI00098A4E20|nr:RGG repeats nuclear RNA binding protein C-like [Aegilops tauschii subsp. strangulata]
MTTLNQFDLLGDIDNDDPSHLLAAAAAAAAKKALANKTEAAPAGKAGQTVAAAKLPTKPAPLAQAARDARSGGPPSRGGFGRGEPGRGRGGDRYGQNRDFGGENTNGYLGGYGGVGSGDGAVTGGGDGERGPRPYRGGGGRRGGYRSDEFGDDSERPPQRNYERHSGTGRGQGMKRDGAGRGNWGSSTDEGLAQETNEALKIEDNAPIAEKQGEQDDAPSTAVENKDHKDGAAKEEEENEEDKVKAAPRCNLCAEIALFI